MKMLMLDPTTLEKNPWNSNKMTVEMQTRLYNSINRLGFFRPIVVREHNSSYQILGGQHRAEIAMQMGIEVPVMNLGSISDKKAKEIGIVDNGRYGQDQADLLASLIKDLGDPTDLMTFLPFDLPELEAMDAVLNINLDTLELDDEDAPPIEPRVKERKTHCTMKFQVPIEDQSTVEDQIKAIIADQEFTDSNSAINAGDALLWLIRNYHESNR